MSYEQFLFGFFAVFVVFSSCWFFGSCCCVLYFIEENKRLTVVFSKQFKRWWCCILNISWSLKASLQSRPLSWANNISSALFLLFRKAAPLAFLAMRMRAWRAFWKKCKENKVILGPGKVNFKHRIMLLYPSLNTWCGLIEKFLLITNSIIDPRHEISNNVVCATSKG